jgi:glyoxylase-like metal-dependent hydrolase (beta-lactamase superfamily II)
MQTWKIGEITIRRVVELEVPLPYSEKRPFIAPARPEALAEMPWLKPHFVTAEGHLNTAVHALLVEAPGMRLIVDTCIGNDKPRAMLAHRALHTSFLEHMQAAGWPPESVDAVLCTHLHVDHVGWNTRLENGRWVPTFARARYFVGRAEYAHWSAEATAEQRAVLDDSVQPIFDAGLAQLVESDAQLTPEIRLRPTPGHTPGHVSVEISSRGERALITGDTVHHPCQIGRPEWCTSFDGDPSAATTTRRALFEELAGSPVLVIGTHFATPTAGRVVRDGSSFRFDV